MRKPILVVLIAALLSAVSLAAAQSQPQASPKEKKKPRKVWTEEDLAGLGGRINVVGTEAPPAPAEQPAVTQARPADALWKELDDLLEERKVTQVQIDLNRASVEALNQKLSAETDPDNINELLQGREWQEAQVAQWEAELERVNTRIAELERLTAGRKRPPKPAPVKTEKVRPAGEEGEAQATPTPAEEPPKEEPPAEEPPPPPPSF
ncbi:MAG: hypothetical protein L0212_03545 [Acidobacteria bacterium]|nr:hypothetical protein [Acidobacteriota bacterium]